MVELCDECGFDARELTGNRDVAARLGAPYADLGRLLDHSDADRSPAAETWSAREYVDHCAEVAGVILGWVANLTDAGTDQELATWRPSRRAVAVLVPPLSEAQSGAVLHGQYEQPVTVEWPLRHLLHDTEHHVLGLRRGYASLGMADHPEISFRGRAPASTG